MRKAKLSFNLFAQQHGNDGLFARFYRHPGSGHPPQRQVSKAPIAKIAGGSLPPFTALSRQGGYAHTLKGYFYTNLGGTLSVRTFFPLRRYAFRKVSRSALMVSASVVGMPCGKPL